MSDQDISVILRALGKVEGKIDGIESKTDSHSDSLLRIDSKMNGVFADIWQRIEKEKEERQKLENRVTTAEVDFVKEFKEHGAEDAESFGTLKAQVKRLTRYALLVLVGNALLLATFAPEQIPRLVAFVGQFL